MKKEEKQKIERNKMNIIKANKKPFCPKKGENHEEFYKNNPEFRTPYWVRYFTEKEKKIISQ